MKRVSLVAAILWMLPTLCPAYIEAPHTIGRICKESTTITLVEVSRVNTDKNLVIYRKIKDLKGKHPQNEIKHNIGQRGNHPREWQTVMAWAKPGRRALFFHNGNASLTAIDQAWYQCFLEGEWWAMSHAEPFLLRTYYGSAERLISVVPDVLAGKQVVVPAMVDGPKEQFQLRTGKVHRIRAGLKLLDYDAKRDFVALGAGEEPEPQGNAAQAAANQPARSPDASGPTFYRAINLNGPAIRIDQRQWEASNAANVEIKGQKYENQKVKLAPAADEPLARMLRSCVYGQECGVAVRNVPAGQYQVYLYVWEDNNPEVFDVTLNGRKVVSRHNSGKAGQWNKLGPFPTTVANGIIAIANPTPAAANFSGVEIWRTGDAPATTPPSIPRRPTANLVIDKGRRMITVPCLIAPRKLPHLGQVYPLEVVATYPSPQGQKSHETIITFDGIAPSQVHAALGQLGLKPGKPAHGQNAKASGPLLKLSLEISGPGGQPRRIPIEQAMIDRKSGKAPAPFRWHFTGSVMRQPDPEKDDRVYGADVTGTLVALFPVTDDVVIQSHLTMEHESTMRLETNPRVLPPEKTAVKLLIEVAGK